MCVGDFSDLAQFSRLAAAVTKDRGEKDKTSTTVEGERIKIEDPRGGPGQLVAFGLKVLLPTLHHSNNATTDVSKMSVKLLKQV